MSPSEIATLKALRAAGGSRRTGQLNPTTLGHLTRKGLVTVEVKTEQAMRMVAVRYREFSLTPAGAEAIVDGRTTRRRGGDPQ